MLVVDTNVIVKLTVEDPHSGSVRTLLNTDFDWIAPALWRSELRNVLHRYVRAGHLTLVEARHALADSSVLIENRSVEGLDVLGTAAADGLAAYDAEFVALARAEGVRLATYDKRVLAACPDTAARPEALGDA